MADLLEILRKDALQKRLHGIAGGLRVHWSARDAAVIHDHVMKMKPELIARDISASRKLVDINVAAIRSKSDARPDDLNELFRITSEDLDSMDDIVMVGGIRFGRFNSNPVVLFGHDATMLPIAASSTPAVSGKGLTAIAKFPQRGISENSDRVAAAIRAGLLRGASIGFQPLKWSFSRDPARPMGIDYHSILLAEWSIVSLPANPSCLLLGPVASKSVSRNRELKSGRAISSANEALLRAAMDHHEFATQCVKDVLDSNTSADDDPDDPYDHGDDPEVINPPEARRLAAARKRNGLPGVFETEANKIAERRRQARIAEAQKFTPRVARKVKTCAVRWSHEAGLPRSDGANARVVSPGGAL